MKIGRIYKLSCLEHDFIYIGSTTLSLNQRLSSHRSMAKRYLDGRKNIYITSIEIVKHPSCKIELLEELEFENRKDLNKRERFYIEQEKQDCINLNVPSRNIKEYYKDNKENYKNYYIKNKDYLQKKYQDNKENYLAYQKQYRLENQDKIKKYRDDYFNREKMKIYQEAYREKKRLEKTKTLDVDIDKDIE